VRILLLTLWKPARGGIVTHVENLIAHSRNEFSLLTYPRTPDLPFLRAAAYLAVNLLRGLRRECDVLHAHYTLPQGLLGRILKGLKRRPLVVTIHGSDLTRLARNPLLRPLLRWVLLGSDRIIVVSRFLEEEVVGLRVPREKVRVIYNGVQEKPRVPQREKKGRKVLFVGNLVPQKGVDVLLEAQKILERKGRGPELLIVGDGKEREALERLSRVLGLEGVRFLGLRKDTEALFRESSLFVLPSREEGFGLVLLEAMSHGVPVVAAAVGGIGEIIENGVNGLLVEKEDPDALAQAIEGLLSNDSLRCQLVEKGYQTVERFRWPRMAREVDAIYEDVALR
jgi:glycosyltransferase involved in cell wall biosynthesis